MKKTKDIYNCDECGVEMDKPYKLELLRNNRTFSINPIVKFLGFEVKGFRDSKNEHGATYHLCKECTRKIVNDFQRKIGK